MTHRIVALVNVGVNSSHGGLRSPIFSDQTFEFVPIPDRVLKIAGSDRGILYRDLKSMNGVPFDEFLPSHYLEEFAHVDPDFRGLTYGDYPEHSPRASNLRKLSVGDFLVFFCRLVPWFDRQFVDERAGFYFIGYFEIERIYMRMTCEPDEETLESIKENAHVIRGICDPMLFDGFWVFKGSRKSRRFTKAIPLDRNTVEELSLTDRFAHPWNWKKFRSDNAAIGSHLRSVRIVEWDQLCAALRIHECC